MRGENEKSFEPDQREDEEMSNPIRRMKARAGAAIQWRVKAYVDQQLAGVLTTIHGMSVQIARTSESLATWRAQIEGELSEALRSGVVGTSSDNSLLAISEELSRIDKGLKDLSSVVEKLTHNQL